MRASIAGAILSTFGLAGAWLSACSLNALDDFSGGPTPPGPLDASDALPPTSGSEAGTDSGAGDGAVPLSPYARAVLEDRPLAYYRFEEVEGASVLVDEIGAHPGDFAVKPRLGVPGVGGGHAAEFVRGSQACAHVDHGGAFDFAGRPAMTLEMWIRPAAFKNYSFLLTTEGNTSPRRGWSLLTKAAGILAFEQYSANSTTTLSRFATNEFTEPPAPIATGAFAHLVMRWTATSGTMVIDGRSVYNTGGGEMGAAGTRHLYLGCLSNGIQAEQYLEDGIIDEVAIYGHALSDARIRTHYDLGKAP